MKLRLATSAAVLALALGAVALPGKPAATPRREEVRQQFRAGNLKDAYDGFRQLALDPADDAKLVGEDLNMAADALQQLGRLDELDAFRAEVIRIHAQNWRLLWGAANSYLTINHLGMIIAGKFVRAAQKPGGQAVNSLLRDRSRALQLMVAAMPLADAEAARNPVPAPNNDAKPAHAETKPVNAEVANFYFDLAGTLMCNAGCSVAFGYGGSAGYVGCSDAWRLQTLTDLDVVPDYLDGWNFGRAPSGAPVDAEGHPVYYTVPKSWPAAVNDGQRWRWALAEAAAHDPSRGNDVRWLLASFLERQFGVQTMADYGSFFANQELADETQPESPANDPGAKKAVAVTGTFALHTLTDDETIARLATGIQRFKLPDEFNYIKLYQQIADQSHGKAAVLALEQLAHIYENRRQFERAADYWRLAIKRSPANATGNPRQGLDQVVGNWGRFEPTVAQPAGKGATLEFRFRNARKVHFAAREIKFPKLLADIKAYVKSKPAELDLSRIELNEIGESLIDRSEKDNDEGNYLGAQVAAWELELKPRAGHVDRRVTVATPLEQAGAYLVTAQLADGNTSRIIVWLQDTAIVRKPLANGMFYYVADAATGQPIAKANLEFFGYRQTPVAKPVAGGPTTTIDTLNFAEQTDAQGQLIRTPKPDEPAYSWLIMATAPGGRLAFLGFTNVWYPQYSDPDYNQTKVFLITDRPVYRPTQTVKYKFWVRHTRYDQPDASDFANQSLTVELHDPKGTKILTKTMTADAYGGIDGEFPLPADAMLGVYQLQIAGEGGDSFRVEEYKKPEFEVLIDAPTAPVRLGDTIRATIRAKYYFGSPVTKAKVKYRVLRTRYSKAWYPPDAWDWLYGRGYWWFAYDMPWLPGWRDWGFARPHVWWWPQAEDPPEVIADREVDIGPDGTVAVDIDTALAQAVHPDQDHQYQISAEVVDPSRRTIVGVGDVLVARKAFQVFAWVDRGYYRTGDVIRAEFHGQTLAGKPVRGDGKLSLFKIAYRDAKPVETLVRTWNQETDEQGEATLQIKASEPGQYRFAFQLTNDKKQTQEGGYVFTIMGDSGDGSDFRFNHLELIPDRRQYAPHQIVNLLLNTNRIGSTVLLFLRPASGVYLKPKLLQLKGKSRVEEIPVVMKDMPNFFIEAITVADGRLYTEVRQITVPPESRVLNVAAQPSREIYRPGQKASVSIKLTDLFGKPFVGTTVVAIYDKAVEYISGGSNVAEIKEFFWQWRRDHSPVSESNLYREFDNLVRPNETWMQDLGVFGESVVEEMAEAKGADKTRSDARIGNGYFSKDDIGYLAAGGLGITAAGGMRCAPFQSGGGLGGNARFAAVPALVQPTVRSNFADTALWVGSLSTNEQGEAEVSLSMPENLTTWKIKVWALGHGTKVGQGEAEIITRKDLIVRLQAPRFFIEKDEVVLSANVQNDLKTKKQVQVALELGDRKLVPLGDAVQQVEVAAGGTMRVDWRVKVAHEGEAVVRMKALTDEESDAVEQKFPVYVHGQLKMDSFSGALRPQETTGAITFNVPAQRRQGQSRLELRYSPTLAGAMVDALPYLADYPYGCTEQTLNRFLPTVITQRILLHMGLDLKKIAAKQTNLNAQEIGNDRGRAGGWKRFDHNPVFDNDEVQRMVKEGVQRLGEMQLSDGGWGWFSGWGEQSYPHTTAVVVHGLQVARENDVALVPDVLERGVEWLKRYQEQQVQLLENALAKPEPKQPYKIQADDLDALVAMVLTDAGVKNPRMIELLYRDRVHLAVYSKAVFGLALEKLGEQDKLAMILKNLSQYVVEDKEDQTAYLKLPEDNYWWNWYGSDVEADAYYLKLLCRTEVAPKGKGKANGNVAPELVKYLLNNRKHASYWNSTRDTSLAIEALADYLKASGEDKPDLTVEVWLDGAKQKEVHITAAELFTFDNKFVLRGDGVTTGKHRLELRKQGAGPLYYNAYLTTFSLEDMIPRAGLEVKVNRKVYKLIRDDKQIAVAGSRGQAVNQRVEHYQREELADLATLKSGDLVEVELEIDSKNDYEYLLFEDHKAAGFEAAELQSGYNGNDLGAYMELRDDRVSFFVRALARGKHSVAYRLRAEIPGKFSALPATAAAMYAPELRGNSDEIKLQIKD